jgi:hypothetical protein
MVDITQLIKKLKLSKPWQETRDILQHIVDCADGDMLEEARNIITEYDFIKRREG